MLHIVCPNTSIDVRLVLDHFEIGEVQRALESKGYPSGKGVNSAFTCEHLGGKALLHAMVGKLDIDYFSHSAFKSVDTRFHIQDGETRRNLTIVDGHGLVAHIQTTGYTTNHNEVMAFCDSINSMTSKGDIILISGSLPKGFSEQDFFSLIRSTKENCASVIVDADLVRFINQNDTIIDYIKPNLKEFQTFSKICERNNFEDCWGLLKQNGIKGLVLTCGKMGSFNISAASDEVLFTKSLFERDGVENIGSGDAFLGAFAYELSIGSTVEEALITATAAGHSNIYHEGPGRIGVSYDEIRPKIQVKKMLYREAETWLNEIIFSQQS